MQTGLKATIRTTGGEGGEYPKAGWVPHLPSHVHNFADSEQRGSEGGAGVPTSCKQPYYAGSLRLGGYSEQEGWLKATGSDGTQQGRSTGLTGPWRKLPIPCRCLKEVAGTTGLEPAASAVTESLADVTDWN
jgi:hypothetical protein